MRRSSTVRKLVAAGAALTLGGLAALAGCSAASDADGGASPAATASASGEPAPSADPAADLAALEGVTVAGDAGAAPTITLPETPFAIGGDAALLLAEGTGAALAEGQVISIHSTWFSGEDGTQQGSTYEQGRAESLVLDGSSLPTSLVEKLVGAPVGSRLLYGANQGTATSVVVVDVAGSEDLPTRASGTAVPPVEGLPAVTLAEDGTPTIAAGAGDTPTELVSQDLVTGTGAVVPEGGTVVVQYSGALWDGTPFDSSWERGAPFSANLTGGVIEGWSQGLAGKTVGSQVLLVVPPALGYGDEDKGTIPPGSTLVFVVDILWASPAA
ncbi:FKBP-type peptidyl-prolyl cis-trans isomerase [Cellulomonas endophytica]|uniref:FKBP-type peptidyl-prolyl cis-trans isomerase n=1 Tax=Cellulomonas endophytica TaxID=2494735 RepID=UPI0010127404|nr:FKBP-type peptidyl-prolyl cis-trans isomerase [Cellulomonas endophytica]